MNIMKKIIIALTAITLATTAGAQENQQDTPSKTAHYITLDFGGGYHNLNYSLGDKGKREPGMGIMGRLGYRYFFSKHWGIGLNGVYKQSMTEAKITDENTFPLIDAENGNLNYNYIVRYNNLKERQKQTSIAVPIGLYFQCNMTEKWKLGFGLGVSAQFVNDETVETVKGDLSTEAYYPKDDITFKDMENHGFYTKSNFKGSYDYKNAFGTFAELNFMYALARWVDLDLGIYGGYGLTKSTESGKGYVYDYETKKYNGALNSSISDGSHQLAIGAMIGFRFKLGKNKTESKPEEKEEVKPAVVVDNKPQEIKKDEPKQPEVKPEEPKVVDNKPEEPKPEEKQPVDGQVVNITDIIGINTGNKPADNNQNTKPADNQTTKPVEPKKDENKVYTEKGKEVYINGKKYIVVDTIRMIINFELGESGNPDITVVDQTLDDVAKYLKEHPDYKLSIVGHTCDLGPDATNKRIGLARANTVKQEFIKRGIPSSRLLTSTKAATQPLVPNTSDQNRSRNRRVELEYVK
jgi:outer membrane protein OmpA-like peptidoglycan-associated protein